jgi:hypothetical protein
MKAIPQEIQQYKKWKARRWAIIRVLALLVAWSLVAGFDGWTKYKKSHAQQPTDSGHGLWVSVDGSLQGVAERPKPLVTDADLGKMFVELDAQYFEGKLPKIPVSFQPLAGNVGGTYSRSDVAIAVSKSESYSPSVCRDTVLHEMAHFYVELNFPGSPETKVSSYGHGEHWRAEMRRLAAQGAFDGRLFSGDDKP